MALPPLVPVEQFALWPEVVIPDGFEDRAEVVLTAVSSRVRLAAGRTWVDEDGELTDDIPDVVLSITTTVAARVWANPAATASRGDGPFTRAWAENLQGLQLTDDERDDIRASVAEEGSTPGLWALATTRSQPEDVDPDEWAIVPPRTTFPDRDVLW